MGRFRLRKRVVEATEPDLFFPIPARFNFTRDVVEAAAAADAFKHAMTFVDHAGIIDRRTFTEIAHDASRWTSLFRSRRLEPGDRVVVLVGRTPVWHSVVLGALKGGFVAVPCPETFDVDELMDRAARCGARAVVTDRAHAPSASEVPGDLASRGKAAVAATPNELLIVEDLRDELRSHSVVEPTHDTAPNDPALILYTTGTTGAPKGAIHTHASLWTMRLQAEHWLDARVDDLVWCTAETGSALFVWNCLVGAWSLGAEIALHERGFRVEERFDLIGRLGVTVLCQPPSEYRLMAEHLALEQFYLGSVRHAVSTGAPLDRATIDTFRLSFCVTIHDGYGQVETGLIVASRKDAEDDVGSLGRPIPGHDIAVIDERGGVVGPGVEGEIALRGRPPSLFAGYCNEPEETESAFLGEWYLTGDRATRDDNGCFWFIGRADGMAGARRDAMEHAVAAEEMARREEEREAAAAAAAQARREDEERTRAADDKRRREEERAAAATAAESVYPEEEATNAVLPVNPPAAAKRSRRQEAAARRSEKAEAKAAARQIRANEKRRREEEIAAAEQARRDEAEARHAANMKAREDEQQSKLDEERRREGEAAAAEQTRRDEAEAQRAAEAARRETDRRESAPAPQPRTSAPAPAATGEEDDERISADLIARLRAYGRGDSSEDALKDQEPDG